MVAVFESFVLFMGIYSLSMFNNYPLILYLLSVLSFLFVQTSAFKQHNRFLKPLVHVATRLKASSCKEDLQRAFQIGLKLKPQIGGFPVLAEILRRSGVKRNTWHLPSAQSIYITEKGNLVQQDTPLVSGLMDIPLFQKEEVVRCIRADQAGETAFPEFLVGIWKAGVVKYEIDFERRIVSYYGIDEVRHIYVEEYPAVNVDIPK